MLHQEGLHSLTQLTVFYVKGLYTRQNKITLQLHSLVLSLFQILFKNPELTTSSFKELFWLMT